MLIERCAVGARFAKLVIVSMMTYEVSCDGWSCARFPGRAGPSCSLFCEYAVVMGVGV